MSRQSKSRSKDTNSLRRSLKLLTFVATACAAYHFSKNQVVNIEGKKAYFSYGKMMPDNRLPDAE